MLSFPAVLHRFLFEVALLWKPLHRSRSLLIGRLRPLLTHWCQCRGALLFYPPPHLPLKTSGRLPIHLIHASLELDVSLGLFPAGWRCRVRWTYELSSRWGEVQASNLSLVSSTCTARGTWHLFISWVQSEFISGVSWRLRKLPRLNAVLTQ